MGLEDYTGSKLFYDLKLLNIFLVQRKHFFHFIIKLKSITKTFQNKSKANCFLGKNKNDFFKNSSGSQEESNGYSLMSGMCLVGESIIELRI